MLFPTEGELKQVFEVEGSFYELEVDGRREICRSSLVITRIGTETERTDALFILMNPGRCLPVDQSILFTKNPEAIEGLPYHKANPDHTLCQLMRLMERVNWNKVQVINLSDLRAGQADEFREKIKFMETHGEQRHSVFSLDRKEELNRLIASADRVIAAWGTHSAIRQQASDALDVLAPICRVEGLEHRNRPYYYHPFPHLHDKCMKWLADMEVHLQGDMEPV